MLYAQATFRQGLQSFRKRHHPDFRRQLSTPWTSRARCCRLSSFHTGGAAPGGSVPSPARCAHIRCANPHPLRVQIARPAPEISRIFLRRSVWTQVSTQNELECRTMDDDRVSHRSTDAHDAVQRRVSTPAHGCRNLRLRLASCPHLVSHARWKKGRKQVPESRNVNQTCFWRKSNFPPGASQLSGRVLTHFNRN